MHIQSRLELLAIVLVPAELLRTVGTVDAQRTVGVSRHMDEVVRVRLIVVLLFVDGDPFPVDRIDVAQIWIVAKHHKAATDGG